ncbi:MAG: alpha/beta hydrolase [Kiritimatiellae bacterium]|nr:alpha/beta hydrolase [Kiritimatiellia bacterium]
MKQIRPPLPLVSGEADTTKETIILIHGMMRTGYSMRRLGNFFAEYGYNIVLCSYESTKTVNQITNELFEALAPIIQAAPKVHFVTHSLGGIILRNAFKDGVPPNMGNVVMYGPPNKGCQHIDHFSWLPFFSQIWGKPAKELGTSRKCLPNRLPPINFHCGIIAGTLKGALGLMLPGKNDGKVTVVNTWTDGAAEQLVLPLNHTFMMKDSVAMKNAVHFLKYGKFCDA